MNKTIICLIHCLFINIWYREANDFDCRLCCILLNRRFLHKPFLKENIIISLKNVSLLLMQEYVVRELSFLLYTCFLRKIRFIYSIIMLFWKIAYYLSRFSWTLKLRSFSQKIYVFLNFVEKDLRLKWKKESWCYCNYQYWIRLSMPK